MLSNMHIKIDRYYNIAIRGIKLNAIKFLVTGNLNFQTKTTYTFQQSKKQRDDAL